MNRCVFVGNLASEPMYYEGETPRVQFTLAVDQEFRSADGQKKADFLDFVAWRGTADFVHKYCHKGDVLAVDCKAKNRDNVNQDGQKSRRTEFLVEELKMIRRSKANSDGNV